LGVGGRGGERGRGAACSVEGTCVWDRREGGAGAADPRRKGPWVLDARPRIQSQDLGLYLVHTCAVS
jgi:hypothetical protein